MSNCSIWSIDRTISGATTMAECGPGSNGNEEVLHITQSSTTGDSPSNYLMSYLGLSFRRGIFSLFKGANSVFCSPPPQPTGQIKDLLGKIIAFVIIRLQTYWFTYVLIILLRLNHEMTQRLVRFVITFKFPQIEKNYINNEAIQVIRSPSVIVLKTNVLSYYIKSISNFH